MVLVHLYSKDDCHLCDIALKVIEHAQLKHPFQLLVTKINEDHPKYGRFKEQIPVVFVEGEQTFMYKVNEERLLQKIKEYENNLKDVL